MREGGLSAGKTWGSVGNIRFGRRAAGRCQEGTRRAAKLENNRKREAFAKRKKYGKCPPFLFQSRKFYGLIKMSVKKDLFYEKRVPEEITGDFLRDVLYNKKEI